MTMFAEPILASSAEERMEGMRRDMENCRPRDYHHYPQHHETPDHLREKNYHYSDSDDREVGRGKGDILCQSGYYIMQSHSVILSECNSIRHFSKYSH